MVRCIPNLVSTNMATKLQKHILYKTSMGEKLSVDKLCSVIESSEVLQPDLRISHPLTLPGSCLYLEFELNETQIEPLQSNFSKVYSRYLLKENRSKGNEDKQ